MHVRPLLLSLSVLFVEIWCMQLVLTVDCLLTLGAAMLGDLGAVVGWPLYMNAQIIAANCGGVAVGEWKGTSTEARKWMGSGLFALCISVVIIGYGNAK
jgi:hypothetical protein